MQRQAPDPSLTTNLHTAKFATTPHPDALLVDSNVLPQDVTGLPDHLAGCQCPACLAYAQWQKAQIHPLDPNSAPDPHGAAGPAASPVAAHAPAADPAGVLASPAAPAPAGGFAAVPAGAFAVDSHAVVTAAAHVDAPLPHLGDHLIAL
jgi:hypothetical protein